MAMSRRRMLWIVVAIVAAAGLLTWLAFGVGINRAPADPTNGVELVPSHDRTAGPR